MPTTVTPKARPRAVPGHTVDVSYRPLLVTLALGVFAGAFDLGVLSPALHALGVTFAVGPRALAWVYTLYLLANVVSIPIAAKLADTYGRRPIYIACVATFAVGSVLAIVAPNFAVFLIARAMQAIGAGGIFPVATAAIADRVPLERRGAAFGIIGAMWGLAAILGPIVGSMLTHFLSWHWIFAANIPLAIVVIVLARVYVPTGSARVRGPLDVKGIALLAVGLLGAMIALTRIDADAATIGGALVTAVALLVAAAAFITLGAVERTAAQPVIAPAVFRDRQLAITFVLEIVIGLLEGALFFIPASLVAAQQLPLPAAGGIAAVGAFVFVAVIPLAGRALDFYGSRVVLMVGSTLTAIGLGIFAFGLGSLVVAIVAMVVAGFGFGALLGSPTRYIVTNRAPVEMRATASGLLSVFLIIGQIVGGSLAGGLIGSDAADVSGYQAAYTVFAVLGIIAIILSAMLDPRERERRESSHPAAMSAATGATASGLKVR